jgi:hypothetical protein
MLVLEQVASVDKDFVSLRLERSRAFVERNAGFIRRLQRDGLADPGLDPDLAALALSVMVSRSAYAVLAVGLRDADLPALAATVTRLWLNGLQIPAHTASAADKNRGDPSDGPLTLIREYCPLSDPCAAEDCVVSAAGASLTTQQWPA